MKRVEDVFSETLHIGREQVHDGLKFNAIREWDSVAHMSLIAALEEAYNVMIDTDDVIDMSSVAKAKEILGKYGVDLA